MSATIADHGPLRLFQTRHFAKSDPLHYGCAQGAATWRAKLRPATVLLVDDEELVRIGTAEMLIDLGYSVIQSGSGVEALAILRNGEIEVDIIVTDYLMPGIAARR